METFSENVIDQIPQKMQEIFEKQFSGESEINDLLRKIPGQIRDCDVKGQIILKQQLGKVLTEMENVDTRSSNNTFFKPRTSSSNVTRVNKVKEGLKCVVDKATYLKNRMELVGKSEEGLELVGREKEKEDIVDQLMLLSRSGDGGSPVPVIVIAGLAGIGKTKLAREVCQDQKVKEHVGFPAWVIGTNCNTFHAPSIAKQVNDGIAKKTKSSPNIIVILDDWRVEIGEEDVKALQRQLKLCVKAIVITTRNCLVAKNIAAVKSFALAGLNQEETLSLFQKITERDAGDHSSIPGNVWQCRGVPLAIITMAKCIQSSRSTEFIEELIYSYYDEGLPHLCFAYCSLFPPDYGIDAERLIHLWTAEGFLKLSNPSTSSAPEPEKIGRRYLRDMVERSIFQEVEEDEFGQVRSCKMHPLMHDIATFVADRENITFLRSTESNINPEVQRAAFNIGAVGIPVTLSDKAKQLKSIRLFGKQKLFRLETIFKSFMSLCVLDLRDMEIKEVPSSIGELKGLEYLDLSKNDMEKLPSSIAKLSKLQTLKLSGCGLLKKWPKNLKNVTQLKNLYMEGCLGLTGMPRQISNLTSLQTLSAFVVNKKDPMGGLEELAKFNELKGNLEILYLDRVEQFLENSQTVYLENKQHLERLTLKWDSKDQKKDRNPLQLLDCLRPHVNLGVLILEGYQGPRLSSWLTSINFERLVKLSLQDCPGCKYLSEEDQLPQLKILQLVRLDNLEYVTQNCRKDAVFYKALEELKISDCPNLKSWWQTEVEVNERPFFVSISKLYTSKCPLLTCMPLYPRLEGSTSFGKKMFLEDSSLKLLLDTSSCAEGFSIPLENLHIQNCNHLDNLSNAFQHLSSLQCLTIGDCKNINLDGQGNEWEGLKSLRELTLKNCPSLISISDNIQLLTSLRRLEICRCKNLKSLPKAMEHIKSLKSLIILHCPSLQRRCQRETGDEKYFRFDTSCKQQNLIA